VIDQQMIDNHRVVREKMKTVKLDPSLLEWVPHLSSSAIELEESRVEIEVTV